MICEPFKLTPLTSYFWQVRTLIYRLQNMPNIMRYVWSYKGLQCHNFNTTHHLWEPGPLPQANQYFESPAWKWWDQIQFQWIIPPLSTHTHLTPSSPCCYSFRPPGLTSAKWVSNSESVVAFTSPPVAIFKLLIFSSSAASIELHSITSHIFVAKCFNKTSWDWLLAPNHSAATFVGRGGAKFTGSKATSTAVA